MGGRTAHVWVDSSLGSKSAHQHRAANGLTSEAMDKTVVVTIKDDPLRAPFGRTIVPAEQDIWKLLVLSCIFLSLHCINVLLRHLLDALQHNRVRKCR